MKRTRTQINSTSVTNFLIQPKERITLTLQISSAQISAEEERVSLEITSLFSGLHKSFQIFAGFRSPEISLSRRIENLGTLPILSKFEFSVSVTNHEEIDEYIILRPLSFESFSSEIFEKCLSLYSEWNQHRGIYSSDFHLEDHTQELNSYLTYLSKSFQLQFTRFIWKVPAGQTLVIQALLDTVYSDGTLSNLLCVLV